MFYFICFSYPDNPSAFKIVAFDDSLSESQGITYEVKNFIFAPNYDISGIISYDDYDLAIVEIKQVFRYTVFSFIGDELNLNSPAASSLYAVAHGLSVSIVISPLYENSLN